MDMKRDSALLIVDVITDFEFEDGSVLFRNANRVARNIRRLKSQFLTADLPALYVNDSNEGKIKTIDELLERAEASRKGAAILIEIKPEREHIILKPQRSGFFGTELGDRLATLGVQNVTVVGWTTDICVLFTAHDAFMRKLKVSVPADCCTAVRPTYHEHAIRFLRRVAEADVDPSRQLFSVAGQE